MIKFNLRPVEQYTMMLEKVFDIEGVMALAWYSLSMRSNLTGDMNWRIPMLIVEGLPCTGKTELARAIAAVDVPEGLKPEAAFHNIATMESAAVKELMEGKGRFVVMESLQNGIPNASIKALQRRLAEGPQVLLTSLDHNANSIIGDDCIILHLPKRTFSRRDRELLEGLHEMMKTAWMLKPYFFYSSDKFGKFIDDWQKELTQSLKDIGLITDSDRSQKIISFYSIILGHWQSLGFFGTDMLNRMATYALRSLSRRLPSGRVFKKKVMELERKTGGKVVLIWHQPDGQVQTITFNNEILFKGFVETLKLMMVTGAGAVEINV